MGELMGLEGDGMQNDELTQMEMDMMNAGGQKIQIRMFIDMDEDDGNEKNININEMFKRTDPKPQVDGDVS